MTSRQSRLRERRKAEGGVRVDVMLSGEASDALSALGLLWRGETLSSIIGECLVERADRNAALFKRKLDPNF